MNKKYEIRLIVDVQYPILGNVPQIPSISFLKGLTCFLSLKKKERNLCLAQCEAQVDL